MPTEVIMEPRERMFIKKTRQIEINQSYSSTETKSGNMILVNMNGRRQGVQVKVYRTSLEHFAVLYPQKKICRPLGVINLKNTQLEKLPDHGQGFTIRQHGYDTPLALTFVSESARELDSWVVAFTSRISPTFRHHSALPIVQEDEEV